MKPPPQTPERPTILVRTLNVCRDACVRRYDEHYHPRHPSRHLHIVADSVLVTLVVVLLVGLGSLLYFRPLAPTLMPPAARPATTPLLATATLRLTTLEGEPLWAGPLPLAVGRQTRLRIFLDVVGLQRSQQNLIFTARAGGPSVELVSYGAASRGTMTLEAGNARWQLGVSATDESTAQSSIEVAITPTPEDAGKSMALLSDIAFSGTDTNTGSAISQRMPDVPTATLPNELGVVEHK